jgi:O-antigen/teichoic acid export membrane protein
MSEADFRFRSLRSNALSVLIARLAVPALNLALVISIARRLGVVELGVYTILVTGFLVLENLKSFGLPTLVVREVAKDQGCAHACHRALVDIGLAGAVIGIAAVAFGVRQFMSPSLLAPAIVMSLGLLASAYALANDALFLSLGNAQYTALITSAENLLRLVVSLACVWLFHQGVLALAAVYVLTRLGAAIAGVIVIKRKLNLRPSDPDRQLVLKMLRAAPEFLTIFAFPILLFRMDVVLLGFFAGDYAVGIYAVAMRLIAVCLIVPDSIMTAAFAFFSKTSNASSQLQFRLLVQRTMRWMALILFPVTLGGLLLGPFAIRLMFGGRFDASVEVLKILVWALVPFALNRAMGDAMVARGHQRTIAKLILLTLVCSIGFYAVAIPAFGLSGAAWGFVFSVGLLCTLTALYAVMRAQIADTRAVATVWVPVALGMVTSIVSRGSTGLLASVSLVAISSLCVAAFGFAMSAEVDLIRAERSVEAN